MAMIQTFVTRQYNKEGKYIDFFRWGYKKPSTCIKNHLRVIKTMPLICEWETLGWVDVVDNENNIVERVYREQLEAVYETVKPLAFSI